MSEKADILKALIAELGRVAFMAGYQAGCEDEGMSRMGDEPPNGGADKAYADWLNECAKGAA